MDILILGAGLMGRSIAYDLIKFSNFRNIAIADVNNDSLILTKKFLKNKKVNYILIDLENEEDVIKIFKNFDIVISAVPYVLNDFLANIAIRTKTHFLDLGGNNNIVKNEKLLNNKAKDNDVIIIPDCGLAPGLVSIITNDIVQSMDLINFVKIRVGGLPLNPKPPLNYQILFSLNGLINEYIEDALILDNGKIIKKKSMTDVENVYFPEPFNKMEAFNTSGGSSTLPETYKNIIGYLDYKTIRYPGHCNKFKILLDIGLGDEKIISINGCKVIPRNILINLLERILPQTGPDVVLLKVIAEGLENGKKVNYEYLLIDYYDEYSGISAMMRTTGFTVSIISIMIEEGTIKKRGVYCPEEIVPPNIFFNKLKKRGIKITKNIKY